MHLVDILNIMLSVFDKRLQINTEEEPQNLSRPALVSSESKLLTEIVVRERIPTLVDLDFR